MAKRPGGYLLIFVLAMAIFHLMPAHRAIDWLVFGAFDHSDPQTLSDDIVLINVPSSKHIQAFRRQLGKLMTDIATTAANASNRPKAVVLDIYIAKDSDATDAGRDGLEALKKGIIDLHVNGIPVYAGINPNHEFNVDLNPDYIKQHAWEVYTNLLDGSGHTQLRESYGSIWYVPYLEMGDGTQMPALVYQIARDFKMVSTEHPDDLTRPVVLHTGDAKNAAQHAYTFTPAGYQTYSPKSLGTPIEKPDLYAKFVIIGDVAHDVHSRNVPGPFLLAWALNKYIKDSGHKLLATPVLLAGMTLTFSGLAWLIFRVLFMQNNRISNRPWLMAFISALISLTCLGLAVAGFLKLGHIYPQVSFVVFGILVTSGLSWHGALRKIRDAALRNHFDIRDERRAIEYDVFISYSHEPNNMAWVENKVYEPLAKAVKTDGSKLKIFFDKKNIEVGETWYSKMIDAIYVSRFFVPVYSDDYFQKEYCKAEMQHAATIRSEGNEKFVLPIARNLKEIPNLYRLINYVNAEEQPDFIDNIIKKILDDDSISDA